MLAGFLVGRSGVQYPWLSWPRPLQYWHVCSHRDCCPPGLLSDAHRHDAGLVPAVAHVRLRGRVLECAFFSMRAELRHCLRRIRRLLERKARKGAIRRTSICSVGDTRDGLWEGVTDSALVATTPLTRLANSGGQLAASRDIRSR
jgi:hypothetical protein